MSSMKNVLKYESDGIDDLTFYGEVESLRYVFMALALSGMLTLKKIKGGGFHACMRIGISSELSVDGHRLMWCDVLLRGSASDANKTVATNKAIDRLRFVGLDIAWGDVPPSYIKSIISQHIKSIRDYVKNNESFILGALKAGVEYQEFVRKSRRASIRFSENEIIRLNEIVKSEGWGSLSELVRHAVSRFLSQKEKL